MCDPLTIAGLALSAGSAVAGSMAQSKATKAREQVMSAERERQHGYDQEAAVINARSQNRYKNFEGQQTNKSKELGDYINSQTVQKDAADAAATAEVNAPVSGSNVTVMEEGKQRGDARAFTDKQGAALGNLRSFGDLLGGISRDQARDSGYIGQLGGFKKGSGGLVAQELENANGAGNGIKAFGDILGVAGQAMTGAGLQGSFGGKLPTVAQGGMGPDIPAGFVAPKRGIANMFNIFGG